MKNVIVENGEQGTPQYTPNITNLFIPQETAPLVLKT